MVCLLSLSYDILKLGLSHTMLFKVRVMFYGLGFMQIQILGLSHTVG